MKDRVEELHKRILAAYTEAMASCRGLMRSYEISQGESMVGKPIKERSEAIHETQMTALKSAYMAIQLEESVVAEGETELGELLTAAFVKHGEELAGKMRSNSQPKHGPGQN
jgi:hypothetical protein